MPICAVCSTDNGRSIDDRAFLCSPCWTPVSLSLQQRYAKACKGLCSALYRGHTARDEAFAKAVDAMHACTNAARAAQGEAQWFGQSQPTYSPRPSGRRSG